MVLITVITQIFILIKNAIVASNFGISAELDAFNLANNISNFIYSFVGAGISTIVIPYLKDKSNKEALDIFISVIYTACIVILIIMLVFRSQFITILSGSNDIQFINMASKLFIFTIITGFVNCVIQLIRAVMEFHGQFNRQKLIVLFTTILLVVLLWLSNDLSIYSYAILVLLTIIINLTIHLFFLKNIDFRHNINFNIKNNDFKEMIKLFIPTVLSTGVYQISLLIDTLIAARLDVGSITTLSYANAIISMINLLILRNLTSFIYPKLVKKSSNVDRQGSLAGYILFVSATMCLIFILFLVVGREGISILFERGKFTSENTSMVYICALIFALSLPTNGIRDLLYRYFYINKDTFSPFVNSIIVSIINIVVSLVLSIYFGLYGVIIGTVFASYFSLFSITLKFSRKFEVYINKKSLLKEILKILLTTILTLIILLVLRKIIQVDYIFIELILFSVITILVFTILLKVFKSKVFNMKF